MEVEIYNKKTRDISESTPATVLSPAPGQIQTTT